MTSTTLQNQEIAVSNLPFKIEKKDHYIEVKQKSYNRNLPKSKRQDYRDSKYNIVEVFLFDKADIERLNELQQVIKDDPSFLEKLKKYFT